MEIEWPSPVDSDYVELKDITGCFVLPDDKKRLYLKLEGSRSRDPVGLSNVVALEENRLTYEHRTTKVIPIKAKIVIMEDKNEN